jgi:hypothetical protein
LEYSDNLTSRMDVRAVLKTLHSTAQSSGLFPPASRTSRRDGGGSVCFEGMAMGVSVRGFCS